MLLRIVAALFFLFHSILGYANTGLYQNLMIGIDPATGIITGAFHEERIPSIGPSFSCIFAIKGDIRDTYIQAGFPGDREITKGEIQFKQERGKEFIFIRLNENPPGCAQATPVDFITGATLELSRAKTWRAVMIVTAKKAYFHTVVSG